MTPASANGFRSASSLIGLLVLAAGCGGGGSSGGDAASPAAEDGSPPAERGTYLNVVVPSVVARGEETSLRLRVLTQAGLPDYDFEGAFRIDASTSGVIFPDPPVMEPAKQGYYFMNGLSFGQTGVQFLRGVVPGDTVQAVANPINVVDDPTWRVYWGDLNGHSDLSSGARAPAQFLWYAKAVALLDFAALTDNDSWEDKALDDEMFLEVAEILEEHHEAGSFVPILAFEWTSREYGNRLVYFPDRPTSFPSLASGVDTPAKLREAVPAGAVIAVAHPSGSQENSPADPAVVGDAGEALAEIYSSLGIFEMPGSHRASSRETPGSSVRDLLAGGFRGGFVANGDGRISTPGNPRSPTYGDHRYGGGLTAVLAKELTREAILDALRERRCYATTGQRYLVEFTVDGEQMGSVLTVPKGHTAEIYGALGSTTAWMRMEIVGPDGPIAVLTPEASASDVVELTATTEPLESATWCYLRGVDDTGGMAWSSPVWMIPE